MNYPDALALIGGLSNPSKMPWWGWSISAQNCITGSKLAQIPGSVCNGCYALKGFYRMGNVKEALARRQKALDDPNFEDAFVLVLTTLYSKERRKRTLDDGSIIKENRFRWFDSGDLQSVAMLQTIVNICTRCPEILFYMPTKEPGIVLKFLKGGGTIPSNLFIKTSVPMVGDTMKKPIPGTSFATVGRDDDPKMEQCPAPKQGNKCLDCSTCWTEKPVNYHLH